MSAMASQLRKAIFLACLMLATSVFAVVFQPIPLVADAASMPNFEQIVPETFGDWTIDKYIVPLQVSPDVAKMLDTIYDKTLSRTYVNSKGQRVMLSLAYGANQSRALQLHKPEVCYVSQGFRLRSTEKTQIRVGSLNLPVMQMVAELGGRVEPITYWMRMGNEVARGWYEQNKARLKYGLQGTIPDGLLFRMSNISSDIPASYALQQEFATALVAAVSPEKRKTLVGDAIAP